MTWLRMNPILAVALAVYMTHVVGTALGWFVWEPLLYLGMFLWPYPFLLAVQRLVPPDSLSSWFGASLLASVLVVGVAVSAQRWMGRSAGPVLTVALGLLSATVPLAIITGAAQLVARALGWPLGE